MGFLLREALVKADVGCPSPTHVLDTQVAIARAVPAHVGRSARPGVGMISSRDGLGSGGDIWVDAHINGRVNSAVEGDIMVIAGVGAGGGFLTGGRLLSLL